MEKAHGSTSTNRNGLTISEDLLQQAELVGDISVVVKHHLVILKPKSLSEKVRGIIKDTPMTIEGMDQMYFQRS